MSNRRRLDRTSEAIHALDGVRLPGGCDHCDAYQTLRAGVAAGVHVLTVHHDEWCPVLAERGRHDD